MNISYKITSCQIKKLTAPEYTDCNDSGTEVKSFPAVAHSTAMKLIFETPCPVNKIQKILIKNESSFMVSFEGISKQLLSVQEVLYGKVEKRMLCISEIPPVRNTKMIPLKFKFSAVPPNIFHFELSCHCFSDLEDGQIPPAIESCKIFGCL